jgi:hypothetical protein
MQNNTTNKPAVRRTVVNTILLVLALAMLGFGIYSGWIEKNPARSEGLFLAAAFSWILSGLQIQKLVKRSNV